MNYSKRTIDEEKLAVENGYRNFVSFVFVCYYKKKFSLKKTGSLIGVSATKIKTSLVKRGFPIRRRGLLPGVAPKTKRHTNIVSKVRTRTPFLFPWCAVYSLYVKSGLTAYEIAKALDVSPTYVYKLLRKYGIESRKNRMHKV